LGKKQKANFTIERCVAVLKNEGYTYTAHKEQGHTQEHAPLFGPFGSLVKRLGKLDQHPFDV
jgi:hypothetical protein